MARILIIDDEEMVRTTIGKILVRAKFDVVTASNGKEGLEKQTAQPADLVITDIIMPQMDGVETTMALRKQNPKTKIIAISGGGRIKNFDFLEQAQKMGAAEVLPKPFTSDQLLEAVTRVLEAEDG